MTYNKPAAHTELVSQLNTAKSAALLLYMPVGLQCLKSLPKTEAEPENQNLHRGKPNKSNLEKDLSWESGIGSTQQTPRKKPQEGQGEKE